MDRKRNPSGSAPKATISTPEPDPLPAHVLTFSLGDEWCAVSLAEIEEILPLPKLTRVPEQPSFVAGWFDLGGKAVPVLHLQRLLNLPDFAITVASPLILSRWGADYCAFAAIEIGEIVPGGAIQKRMPIQEPNSCVREISVIGQRPHSFLVGERIMLEGESRRLAEYREREQQRLAQLQVEEE